MCSSGERDSSCLSSLGEEVGGEAYELVSLSEGSGCVTHETCARGEDKTAMACEQGSPSARGRGVTYEPIIPSGT